MAVSQELLEILRCPYCVSGPTRKAGNDPGRLELVREVWLVCQEPDCGRKYPIKEDIPVMLIEEGEKWMNTLIDELPEPGLLVDPAEFSITAPVESAVTAYSNNRKQVLAVVLSLLALLVVVALIISLQRRSGQADEE